MRPLARHLFTLSSAASLLLFVAVAFGWIHSSGLRRSVFGYHGVPDAGGVARGWELGTARGRVIFSFLRYTPSDEPIEPGHYALAYRAGSPDWTWLPQATADGVGAGGFDWKHRQMPTVGREAYSLTVPCWFLLVLSLVLPAMWWRRRRRYPVGLCPTCGYDLRASPERCPECGTPSIHKLIA